MSLSANYPALAPNLLLDFANTKTVDPRITVTRASTATYFNQLGVLTSAANNVPRIDFNPTTRACNGLLVEEQRTNLLLQSENFADAAWSSKTNITLTTGVISPSGSNNAFTLAATANNAVLQQAPTVTAGVALSGSIWIRRRTGNGQISLRVGELAIIPITVTNDWTRVSATNTPTTTTGRFGLVISVSGDEVDIWGAQLEAGAFATSYIPTVAATVTRQADAISMTGTAFSGWYNALEGTLFTQAQDVSDATHSSSQPRVASINNGTNSTIDTSRVPASAQARARIDDAGVSQFNSLTTAWPLATQAKIALAYKLNDAAACLGGTTVATDNTVTIPTVNTLTIGNYVTGSGNPWTGWIQRITYYPLRNTNAQLQALTGT